MLDLDLEGSGGAAGGEKHETDIDDRQAGTHAEVGRKWLRNTLTKAGKSEAQLAKQLWNMNGTAVLEVIHSL